MKQVKYGLNALALSLFIAAPTYAIESGPYLGANAGIINNNINLKISDAEENSVEDLTLGVRGSHATLNFGYGYAVNNLFYLGLEAFASVHSVKLEKGEPSASSLKFEYKRAYGINIKPGVIIQDNALVYLLAGYSRGKFDLNIADYSEGQKDEINLSKELDGLNLGIGTQIKLADHWSLNLQYAFTNYKKFKIEHATADLGLTPKIHTTSLGISYSF